MSALKPLVRLLQRSVRVALYRRSLAWMACALLVLVLGSVLSQLFGDVRVIRLGLLMAALSALPAFLLWPLSEKRLMDRLRSIDEETVFEAYLEAEPGPARDILRRLAAERAAALPFRKPHGEPVFTGLGGICAAAIACLVLVEGGSFLLLGHSSALTLERPVTAASGKRIEERDFSEFATEDPAARLARRERALEQREKGMDKGEQASPGHAHEAAERTVSSKRNSSEGGDPSDAADSPARDSVARRKRGEQEEGETASVSNAMPAPGRAPSQGDPKTAIPGGNPSQDDVTPRGNQGAVRPGSPPNPGPGNPGYEHTADTKVPSPLLDYRTRFEARYAERTGRRISASGRMGFGDLRDFQRRYFESFTLKVQMGATDDPYVAQLKRRWNALKGGLR